MDRPKNSSTNDRVGETAHEYGYVLPFPLPASLMDIFQLTDGRPDLADSFLEGLLSGSLSLELPAGVKTAKWAYEQFAEGQNRARIYGGHWLWYGFPLIRISGSQDPLLAPLWLWPLELKPPDSQDAGWGLQLAAEATSYANPQLDGLFRDSLGWESDLPWWHKWGDRPPDRQRLSGMAEELIDTLKLESSGSSVSLQPWSPGQSFNDPGSAAGLVWSGVIGQFPPAYPSSLPPGPAGAIPSGTGLRHHTYGLLGRDPWQETAFREAQHHRGFVVRGRGNSGKSALLLDMVVNALSRGERCMILSDRREALKALKAELVSKGLGNLVLDLQQSPEEGISTLNRLRSEAKNKSRNLFSEKGYDEQIARLGKQEAALDQVYQAVNKRILGPLSWTQAVGWYLAAARQESKALLASQLNAQDFDLSYEAFLQMSDQLSRSQALFDKLKTLNHPLTVLNAGIFVHQEKEEAGEFILSRISEFMERATELQHDFILEQNDYGDRLVESYEHFYRQLLEHSSVLQEKIKTYRKKYGRDPLESTRTTLKLYAGFSERFRKTLAAKDDIALGYEKLEKYLAENPFLQHSFLPPGERHLLGNLLVNLESLLQQLHQWREQLGVSVQEELIRLSSKTVHTSLPGYEIIEKLESRLDRLIEELNDSGLLQLPLENKNLTLPKRQRFLEEIIEKLDRLRFNMRDFDRFYDWQRYWFSLPAESRRIITALVKVKPNDWAAAFSSWFLHQELLKQADPHLPESRSSMQGFLKDLKNWRSRVIDTITSLWADRRSQRLKKLKKEHRAAYDFLLSGKHQGTDALLKKFPALLPSLFPVMLSSPYTSYDLSDLREPVDCLFIDEAHCLGNGLLELWKGRAGKVILFYNPVFGEQQLSTWANRQGWPQYTLEGNYSSSQRQIILEEVSGRYNSRQKINDEEARKLFAMLNLIEEKPDGLLPSVAIVCLTRPQRNLIIQYLDRITKQKLAGADKIVELEKQGLGIFVPDEIFGLHADLLILSCTFGCTGAADQLTPDLQQLDRTYRPGLVPLLDSRAGSALWVLHSIPREDLLRMAKEKTAANTAELARWITALAGKESPSPGNPLEEWPIHPLAGEVAWLIADQVRTDRLSFNIPAGEAILPMTVAPLKGDQVKAVILNGFLAETPATSYEWEWSQQTALLEKGFDLHPIWSGAWWKRPGEQAAAFIAMANAATEEE